LLVVFSSFIVDWPRVLKLSQCDRLSASTVLVILALSLAVSFQGGCLDAWMRAYGEAALSGFVAASTRLCELVVAAVLLLCGVGFVGVAGGYLASAVLVRAIHSYIALTHAPPELRHLGTFEISGVRRVMKPASGFVALSLTQALTIQGGVQVLNQLATPSQVVAFTMSRTLMRLVLNIGVVINNALRSEVSLLLGAGQRAVAECLMWKSWRFALVSGSAMYVLLVAFGPIFIAVWSGYQIHQNHLALGLIGMHALLGLVWFIPATVQMAGNAHSHYAIFYSVSALLALCLWLLFAKAVEPFLGAALLLAIPELVMVLLLVGSCCGEKRNVRHSVPR
jgi:O-antigen/teichoic acid export membrane protein